MLKKILLSFLLFVTGYGIAIFINYTFSFEEVLLTFRIAIAVYFAAGCCFRSYRNMNPWLLVLPVIIHFTLVSVLVRLVAFVPLLVTAAIAAFLLGMILRQIIMRKKYVLAILYIIVVCSVSWLLLELVYKDELFNEAVVPVEPKDVTTGIHLVTMSGDTLAAADVTGKVLLVETWHIHCGLCKKQFAQMDSLAQIYSPNSNVMVLAINNGAVDTYDEFAAFVNKHNTFRFTYAYDAGAVIAKRLGISASPYTIVIGKDGKVRYLLSGYGKEVAARFIERVEKEVDKALE